MDSIPSRQERLASSIGSSIWMISLAVIGVLIVGGVFFAVPLTDDLGRAYFAQKDGLLEAMRLEYVGWSGRWFGTGLGYAAGLIQDQIGTYWIFLGIVMFVLALAIFRLVTTVITTKAVAFRVVATASFIAIFWTRIQPGQTFYWRTGAFENLLGPSLGILAACYAASLADSAAQRRLGKCAIACLLIVLTCGSHELYGAILASTLAFWVLCVAVSGRVDLKLLGLILGVLVLSELVVVLAPGNKVRMSTQEEFGNVSNALKSGTVHLLNCLRVWTMDLAIWLAAFLLLLDPNVRTAQKERLCKLSALARLSFLAAWLVAVMIGVYVLCFAAGGIPIRTYNAVYLCFLVGWFLNVLVNVHISDQLLNALPRAVRTFAMFVFSGSLLFGPSFHTSYARDLLRDLFVIGPRYRAEMTERDRSIRQQAADGVRDIVVKPGRYHPYMSLSADPSPDPELWVNVQIANYYGVDTVRLAPADEKADAPSAGGSQSH